MGATTLQRDSHVTKQFTQSWMLIALISIASYTHSSDINEILASGKKNYHQIYQRKNRMSMTSKLRGANFVQAPIALTADLSSAA